MNEQEAVAEFSDRLNMLIQEYVGIASNYGILAILKLQGDHISESVRRELQGPSEFS